MIQKQDPTQKKKGHDSPKMIRSKNLRKAATQQAGEPPVQSGKEDEELQIKCVRGEGRGTNRFCGFFGHVEKVY